MSSLRRCYRIRTSREAINYEGCRKNTQSMATTMTMTAKTMTMTMTKKMMKKKKIVHDNKPHMTSMMKITATQNNKRNISKIHVFLFCPSKCDKEKKSLVGVYVGNCRLQRNHHKIEHNLLTTTSPVGFGHRSQDPSRVWTIPLGDTNKRLRRSFLQSLSTISTHHLELRVAF